VDNSPYAYGYQIDNGVPIESWYDDDSDTELLKLLGFLKRVQAADDVRPLIRAHFKTYELVDNAVARIQKREHKLIQQADKARMAR
jgi:CTD small phosphatase-like protein 2